jgi:hypothetical protein
MSSRELLFGGPRPTAVALPFDLAQVVADWGTVRSAMIRGIADGFERSEWAYLLEFISPDNLWAVYEQTFGKQVSEEGTRPLQIARPVDNVAVWLPNNVSLLGPLTTVLLSITGSRLHLKGGSNSADLTGSFLDFVRPTLSGTALGAYLEDRVEHASFNRLDARNKKWAALADVRIVFGSDDAAAQIDDLPHPAGSKLFAFVDRRSEAWVSAAGRTPQVTEQVIKVFEIYGQTGCTSPRRVVVVNGTESQARDLRDELVVAWENTRQRVPEPHVVSANVMVRQWAAAAGWDAVLPSDNGAVFVTGLPNLPEVEGQMLLPVVAQGIDDAARNLPGNIQTVGFAGAVEVTTTWCATLSTTAVKRIVPLREMHFFGPLWDGMEYWRQMFEIVEVSW